MDLFHICPCFKKYWEQIQFYFCSPIDFNATQKQFLSSLKPVQKKEDKKEKVTHDKNVSALGYFALKCACTLLVLELNLIDGSVRDLLWFSWLYLNANHVHHSNCTHKHKHELLFFSLIDIWHVGEEMGRLSRLAARTGAWHYSCHGSWLPCNEACLKYLLWFA